MYLVVSADRGTHRTGELPILGSVTEKTADQSPPLALVTGGGTGIGAAIARRLAADGFQVVVAGRRREKLDEVVAAVEAAGGQARAVVMDVTDATSVQAGVGSLGRCDVLVNNAGGALGVTRVEDGDPEEWERMYSSNVVGTLRVTQGALPLLRQSARATIVDISSIAGERVYEGGAGYVAAKHGTSVLSETLRLELNGENIRVIDIRPGMVRTEEFSLTRLHGDKAAADKVYEGVDRPLVADDVAECVGFVVGLPQHVNIDTMVIKPVAQAAPHKVHRGSIDWKQS
ncbi:MAG: SDR family oxidoreductase [Dermatophilaceae bacterium]|nr:SDR family oxidoreductase [Dermatophilaceae bacterium]